jgi:pimeloyl-ACP methyl ester carboxylesterase
VTAVRSEIRFDSGGTTCAAWHHPGTNGAVVVMAGGFGVDRDPGTDLFARRFSQAGFSVLAFDHRRFGGSGGRPRQVVRVAEQIADWHAAVECALGLPEVDRPAVALWSFSLTAGHLLRVAAGNPRVAAVIAQTPGVDGPAAARNAARYQSPRALARLTGLGLADALGGLGGRDPLLVPLSGRRGQVAVLTTPDTADGERALDPLAIHGAWPRTVAARSALRISFYRPGRVAPRVGCPLLVLVGEQDRSAPPGPAERVARRAPRGELVRLPGGHYGPFLEAHEQAVAAELSFLSRVLLAPL